MNIKQPTTDFEFELNQTLGQDAALEPPHINMELSVSDADILAIEARYGVHLGKLSDGYDSWDQLPYQLPMHRDKKVKGAI